MEVGGWARGKEPSLTDVRARELGRPRPTLAAQLEKFELRYRSEKGGG